MTISKPHLRNVLAIAVGLVAVSSTPLHAEIFEASDDFAILLPDAWQEIPRSALDEASRMIREVSQGAESIEYDYGYQLDANDQWLTYPYILVQVKRDGRVPEGELKRFDRINSQFEEGLGRAEDSFSSILSETEMGTPRYDEQQHVLWSGVTMNVAGVGDIQGLVALKLTEFGYVQIMGYATRESFSNYEPVFRAAVHELRIADTAQYRPRLTDDAPTLWGINLGEVAIAGLIGGAIALVLSAARYLRSRRDA